MYMSLTRSDLGPPRTPAGGTRRLLGALPAQRIAIILLIIIIIIIIIISIMIIIIIMVALIVIIILITMYVIYIYIYIYGARLRNLKYRWSLGVLSTTSVCTRSKSRLRNLEYQNIKHGNGCT